MKQSASDEIGQLRRDVAELERQLDAVRSMAVGLCTATKVGELIPEALDISLKLANSEAGSILLYHPDKKKLVFEYVVGEKAAELTGMEIGTDQGIAGKVFGAGESCVSDDVSKESAHLREVGEKVGYITTNIVTVPLKRPKGDPIGVMQVLNKRGGPFDSHDVTLIEIMAAQIAVAIETARLNEQARLATVMRFIGDISHDVKNMVTPTVSGAETLRIVAEDCFDKFDRYLEECGRSEAEIEHVRATMQELRELYPMIIEMTLEGSTVVQQRMAEISAAVKGIVSKPHFEPSDVASIARHVGAMLDAHAMKKGVAVNIEPQDSALTAVVDGKQIYNAIYNLIFNAIDACSRGDSVTLRVAGNADGEFPQGNCIVLECADTGPGMPEHVSAVLFTDEAISTKPMGTGLGTRIVKNVIDAHGGIIELESELGAGTTVRCRIPASPP